MFENFTRVLRREIMRHAHVVPHLVRHDLPRGRLRLAPLVQRHLSKRFGVRELPNMMSAKFFDFLTPSPLFSIWI